MTITASGTTESKSWEQTPYAEIAGAVELASATGVDVYHGDIDGEGAWRGLTVTGPDGRGDLVSLQRMTCTLGGRTGTFVLHITGTFDADGARASWEVMAGSGTGELAGLTGIGGFETAGETTTYTLDYTVD